MQSSDDAHSFWMAEAIRLTRPSSRTPFACVLVDRRDAQIVATGLNDRASFPMLHAEVAALQNYSQIGQPEWQHITLYSTAEPCPMCQSAILWCGIPDTVFGTSIETLTRIGYRQIEISAAEVIRRSWAADATVIGGVLEAECDALFEQHRRPL